LIAFNRCYDSCTANLEPTVISNRTQASAHSLLPLLETFADPSLAKPFRRQPITSLLRTGTCRRRGGDSLLGGHSSLAPSNHLTTSLSLSPLLSIYPHTSSCSSLDIIRRVERKQSKESCVRRLDLKGEEGLRNFSLLPSANPYVKDGLHTVRELFRRNASPM
jgi:hypothetical protein